MNWTFFRVIIFVMISLAEALAFAAPFRTTYQAKIIKPDGQPLQSSSVNFRFTILDPAASCVLYSEDYTAVNMYDSGGVMAFALGAGVRSFPTSGTAATFAATFDNSTPAFSCQTMGVYLPTSNDGRKIVMQFNDGTGWQTLPAMTINAVPYSMYAGKSENSIQLNGKSDTSFVEYSTLAALNCQANEAIHFNGVSFSCLAVGSSVTSGSVISALGYTPANATSLTTVTSDLSAVSSTVAGVSTYASNVSSTVFSVSSTVTSLQNSVAASFAAITSSQWTTSGTNIFYNTGNIGIGTTTPVTKLDVSGGVRIGAESTTCAPALAGTLRYNASNVEYCNGSSWQAFGVSGAGITNFNGSTSGTQSFATGTGGTAPNFNTSNGLHTLNIPNASTGSVTAGLISNTDYTTFTNKITSSAASIAQVLGYVPADNAASGTYAQKANNLSDLTNVATARTNLGLGTFATASSIDLGSASATGTLAIARLPSFSGDATIAAASNTIILSNSGVTAGAYTKVTVDSKGRVTSGSQITSSDVTTALGYTPANSATIVSSQWTTSGTTINYMTGSVGIGTSNPVEKFVVNGKVILGGTSTLYTGTSSFPSIAADAASASALILNGGSITNTWRIKNANGVLDFLTCADATCTGGSQYMKLSAAGGLMTPAAVSFGSSMTPGLNQYVFNGNASPVDLFAEPYPFGDNAGSDLYLRAGDASTGSTNKNGGTLRLASGKATGTGSSNIEFRTADSTNVTTKMYINGIGNVGIGTTVPTAKLHLSAGTSSTAALKFASGTLLTSPQSGTMEYDGTNFYLTDSTNTRRAIAANTNPGTYDNVSNINSSGNIAMTPVGSVVVSSTTASTNSSTGALIVKGGLGVAGDIYTSGTIVTSSNIQGVSVTATSGMISPYIAGSVVSGGSLILDSTTHTNKGNILLAPNGGSVGIGTASPSTRLDVRITSTDNVAGPTATAYPVASFINNSSGGGQRGLEIGAPTGGFSSPVYIKVSGTSNRLAFLNSSSSETLTIADNGSVGIGTSNPTHALDFQGTVADFALTRSVNSAAAPDIYFQKDRGTVGNPSVMQNGDALGNIGFRGYDGANYIRGALIQVRATSAPATNQMTADMMFSTNNGAADASERMRITAAGNVGIGTSNPQNPLHVIGSIKATGSIGNLVTSTSGQQMEPGDATLTTLRFDSANYRIWNPTLGELLRVQSNGYVGIGTASATAKLSIYSGDDGSMDSVQIHGGSLSASRYGVLNVHDTSEYIRLGYYNGSAMKNIFLDGSVGIGTATPAAKFEISNSTSPVMRVLAGTGNGVDDDNLLRLMPQNAVGEGGHIELKGSASNQDWTIDTVAGELRIFEPGQSRNAVKTRGGVTFSINTSATSTAAVVDALKITNSGYVGLGTNTPQAKLDIFGSTYFASRKGYANYYNVAPYDQMEFGAVGPTTALSLVTSGISRLNITPTGDVGVGTTSPATNLQLGPSGYFGIPANGHPYIPAAWKRGSGGGMIFANSQNADGSGWSYGTRIINHDYGDGLALSFDSLYTGAWTNDVLVISGRSGLARVGIGTALPSEKLHVVGNLRVQGSTDCTLGNGAAGTNCSSDARLKENIKPIPYALEKVISLKGVEFDWNAKSVSQGRHDIGVIAQDVEKVFPTAVMNDQNTGYKKVDYAVLVAPLIQAFKEFYAFVMHRFEGYDRQIASKADKAVVDAKVQQLETENAQLKQKVKEFDAVKAYLCSKDPAASICK